jgi:hypothetical protein
MASWADIVANGGGPVEFRLVIEGCEIEICSSAEMVGDCTDTGSGIPDHAPSGHEGKRRVDGLIRDGLGFSEVAYLAGAELEVSINPVMISETGYPDLDAATRVFSKIPQVVGSLETSLDESSITAFVFDHSRFDVGGYYQLDREVVLVLAKNATPSRLTVDRGQWGTVPCAHNIGVDLGAAERPLYDGVQIWKGRRCWLYAHCDGELDVDSTGTLIWRGTLGNDPELVDDVTWQLSIESRWTILEQEVGGGVDKPRHLKGAYYPGEMPFWMNVRRCPGATYGGATTDDVVAIRVTGWYPSNDAFVGAIVAKLNADVEIVSWGVMFEGREVNGRWELYVTTDSGSPRYLEIWGGSPLDGWFDMRLTEPRAAVVEGGVQGFVDQNGDTPGDVTQVVASHLYLVKWTTAYPVGATPNVPPEHARRIPRSMNIEAPPVIGVSPSDDVLITTDPIGRHYLDDVGGLAVGDVMLVPQPAAADGSDVPPMALEIFSISTSAGYVDMYRDGTLGVASSRFTSNLVVAGAGAPELTVSRSYGESAGINLDEYRQSLIDLAPEEANDGSTPWLTDDDVADWSDTVEECAQGRAYLQRRRYVFQKGQRLDGVLKEEARLLGAFFRLDADFKIALRRLTIETADVASGFHITGANHLTDSRYGAIRSGSDGHLNTIEISRGYDPIEDEYTMAPITIRDIGAIAAAGGRKSVLEIRPKVAPVEGEITVEEAVLLALPAQVLFGGKILHVEVDVPLTMWDVLIGDSVLLSIDELPLDGARAIHDPGLGATNRRGTVVGRSWSLDEPAGTLTILVTGLNVAGYAPTARVASASGATTSWTLTCEANRYAPTGAVDASYFSAGDKIRLIEWDAASPTVVDGTVSTVTGNDIAVTLDSSWAGLGGATYNLDFQVSDNAADDQLSYCYIASPDLFYEDSSAERFTARKFAP